MRKPIKYKSSKEFQRAKEIASKEEEKQILQMAEDFEEAKNCRGFNHLMNIWRTDLAVEEEGYKKFKEATVLEIIKSGRTFEQYMIERNTLETRIKQLKDILETPEFYKQGAEEILNKKTSESPTPGRNSGEKKEE